jgi:tetratricopeptide (TPR) repeat protein
MPIPKRFNIAFSFDDRLREIPSDREEVERAIAWIEGELATMEDQPAQRVALLGLRGVYRRILGEYRSAESDLVEAVMIAEALGIESLVTVMRLRLAHVYQWMEEFGRSTAMFDREIERCKTLPELLPFLDFACQHAGKNLFDQGDLDGARRHFEAALEIRNRKGDRKLIDSTEAALARVMEGGSWK